MLLQIAHLGSPPVRLPESLSGACLVFLRSCSSCSSSSDAGVAVPRPSLSLARSCRLTSRPTSPYNTTPTSRLLMDTSEHQTPLRGKCRCGRQRHRSTLNSTQWGSALRLRRTRRAGRGGRMTHRPHWRSTNRICPSGRPRGWWHRPAGALPVPVSLNETRIAPTPGTRQTHRL